MHVCGNRVLVTGFVGNGCDSKPLVQVALCHSVPIVESVPKQHVDSRFVSLVRKFTEVHGLSVVPNVGVDQLGRKKDVIPEGPDVVGWMLALRVQVVVGPQSVDNEGMVVAIAPKLRWGHGSSRHQRYFK
jgi:hypothetical protein